MSGHASGHARTAVPKAAEQPRDTRGRYQRHGTHTLKRALQALGSRALPTKRTALGRELAEWRAALVADLGGADAVSTQQQALVDLAVRTKLLVDSVDAFVLAMPSGPVNRQKRTLHPIVRERQTLVGQLQSLIRDLGLERRAKDVDLAAELARLHRTAGDDPGHQEAAPAPVSGEDVRVCDASRDVPETVGGSTPGTGDAG